MFAQTALGQSDAGPTCIAIVVNDFQHEQISVPLSFLLT